METLLRQTSQCDEQFRVGVLTKVLDADISRVIVQHIHRSNALGRYLATCHDDVTNLLLAKAHDAQLHLCVLRTLETVHGLLVGQRLTRKRLVVDHHNLIASNDTSTLSRSITNDLLHMERIATDIELDADTRERAAQIVISHLYVLGSNVHGMGV